jgi:hypothetical protein
VFNAFLPFDFLVLPSRIARFVITAQSGCGALASVNMHRSTIENKQKKKTKKQKKKTTREKQDRRFCIFTFAAFIANSVRPVFVDVHQILPVVTGQSLLAGAQ